jgi:hypothetical protein
VVAACGLVLGLAFPAMAQDPPLFRADAELTVLRVGVVRDGEPVLDLAAGDFQVFEDGAERPISVFIAPEWEPLEIVLAMDFSGSMMSWPAKQAASLFLDSLHPGSCVLFVPFGTTLMRGVWGHPADAEIRRLIAETEFTSHEVIFDALAASFVLLRQRVVSSAGSTKGDDNDLSAQLVGELIRFRNMPRGGDALEIPEPQGDCTPRQHPWSLREFSSRTRQAVVMITDGHDHASRLNLDDVLLLAWGSSLPTFVLAGEGTGYGPGHYSTMRKMRRLLEYTGGALFRAPKRDEHRLWNELQRMIAGVRAQYVLGFVPARTSGGHGLASDRRRIEVTIPDGEYDVLVPEHVVSGQVASDTAALDLIQAGFQQIAAGRLDAALETFDAAAATAPGQAPPQVGAVHYGRGIALTRLERPEEALQELRLAASEAPWLPDLEARQSELLLELEDYEAAWLHALRGHLQGSEVRAVVDRLQAVAPRPDLVLSSARQGSLVRVAVQARAEGEAALQGLAVPPVFGAVAQALAEMPDVVVASGTNLTDERPGLRLLVEIDRIRQRNERVEARARLTLRTAEDKKLREVSLHVGDVASTDEVSTAVARAMARVQAAIDEFRSDGPQP